LTADLRAIVPRPAESLSRVGAYDATIAVGVQGEGVRGRIYRYNACLGVVVYGGGRYDSHGKSDMGEEDE